MPFKINHAAMADRRAKAEEIFRAACCSHQAGRLQEAEAGLRIAISFDPQRAEFKTALGSLRLELAGDRAAEILASTHKPKQASDLRETLRRLEDVLIYRPHDPELNERAASACLQLEKFEKAEDYAKTLVEHSPEVAAHHALLGRIYRGQKKLDAAMREFEMATKYDDANTEATRALAAIRISRRDAAQGGS